MSASDPNDTLPLVKNGEDEMAVTVSCFVCEQEADRYLSRERTSTGSLSLRPFGGDYGGMVLDGVLTCLKDGHRWPIRMRNDEVRDVSEEMPITEYKKIAPAVQQHRQDIVQDIKEAEDTYFYRAYKASVVMCRRAVALALEYHMCVSDLTLGNLLVEGRKLEPPALTAQSDQFAKRILDIGNDGAHNEFKADPDDVRVVIHDSVVIINELLTKKTRVELEAK